MNIEEKAKEFAEGKAVNAINKAIEEAYVQGYMEGYKDGQKDMPLESDQIEFVNLGLPSGTEWAAENDYDEGRFIKYVPYCEAEKKQIPTVEQLQELFDTCKWQMKTTNSGGFNGYVVIGPNGNQIEFYDKGYYEADSKYGYACCFWLKSDDEENNEKIGARCANGKLETDTFFSGYKLPIRQVRINK